jgi:hypothetical protein
MPRHFRRFASALALAAVLLAPAAGRAMTRVDDFSNRGSPPMVDLMLMRPIGLAMVGLGCMLFVPAMALTGTARPTEWRTTYEWLVLKPVRFVFVDPLGSH